jgi:hypothetical protein
MPSRKQRRRRAKDRRHEYEYVYVDESGQELEAASEPERKPEKVRAKQGGGKNSGAIREVKPPSWQRSLRRAALFFPLFFIVFSLVNKKSAIEIRLLSSLAYSALFIPLTYLMDRTAHRNYLRRSGRQSKR